MTLLSYLAFITFSLFVFTAPVAATVVDRIVAVVNQEVITLSEVEENGATLFKRIQTTAPREQQQEALRRARKQVLDDLIDNRILMQAAAKQRIQISDKEIDQALNSIVEKNQTTLAQLRQQLSKMGNSEKQYRKKLKKQLTGSRLISQLIRRQVMISETAIRDYYDNHYTTPALPASFHVQQIGNIASPDPIRKNAARERMERVRILAVAGQDFSPLAKKYSELPSAEDGGDLGRFTKAEMAPFMRAAILPLNIGDISPVVETNQGFQFFKLVELQAAQAAGKPDFNTVEQEIRNRLYSEALESRFKDWLLEQRQQAYIKLL